MADVTQSTTVDETWQYTCSLVRYCVTGMLEGTRAKRGLTSCKLEWYEPSPLMASFRCIAILFRTVGGGWTVADGGGSYRISNGKIKMRAAGEVR